MFHVGLHSSGPGQLVAELRKGQSPRVKRASEAIASVRPDILLLLDFDFDAGLTALSLLQKRLRDGGHAMPHAFALPPNTGQPSGFDLDGNGSTAGPRDAIGFGSFPGQGGMAILSRLPIQKGSVQDFSRVIWSKLPGNLAETEVELRLPLSSTGHWMVPVTLPGDRVLYLLAWHATTPAFDGPKDRNGRRNHDENMFWLALLNGVSAPPPPFVLLGSANLDPTDGDGKRTAIQKILADPKLQDPMPQSDVGRQLSLDQAGVNRDHLGDPALDTSDWRDDGGPGNLRAHYVLPSSDLVVRTSGIHWPEPLTDSTSNHGIVWVDIDP